MGADSSSMYELRVLLQSYAPDICAAGAAEEALWS